MKFYIAFILILCTKVGSIFGVDLECPHGCKGKSIRRVGGLFDDLLYDIKSTAFKDYFNGLAFSVEDYALIIHVRRPKFGLAYDLKWPRIYKPGFCWDTEVWSDSYDPKYDRWGLIKKYDSESNTWEVSWDICRTCFDNSSPIQNPELSKSGPSFFTSSRYSSFDAALSLLKKDLDICFASHFDFFKRAQEKCNSEIERVRTIIEERGDRYVDSDYTILYRSDRIKAFSKNISDIVKVSHLLDNQHIKVDALIANAQISARAIYSEIYDECIKNHQALSAFYERGLLCFDEGNFYQSLENILALIEKAKGGEKETSIPIDAYFYKGSAESEKPGCIFRKSDRLFRRWANGIFA